MRFSDAKNHKVVSTATAETVGRVDEFVVDPATRTVVALELKKTHGGKILAWPDLIAFGADAVTVDDADRIGEAQPPVADLLGKDHRLLKKRVLSSAGDELGHVQDVEFDPETAAVTSIVLEDAQVPGAELIGVGSYAVVVRAAG
jgi:sporulation protein YlmC with PRC-barrel domain